MLLSAVSVLVVAQSSSEIPKGLMHNPVYFCLEFGDKKRVVIWTVRLKLIAPLSPKSHAHISRVRECIFADRTTTGLNIVTVSHHVAFWMTSCWSRCSTTTIQWLQPLCSLVASFKWARPRNPPPPSIPVYLALLHYFVHRAGCYNCAICFQKHPVYILAVVCLTAGRQPLPQREFSTVCDLFFLFQCTIFSSFLNIFK